jgi:hypothetical protein
MLETLSRYWWAVVRPQPEQEPGRPTGRRPAVILKAVR